MDRDTVRLILIIVGVIVLAGLYVWGRYKQPVLDYLARGQEEEEPLPRDDGTASGLSLEDDDLFDLGAPGSRKEPHLSGLDFPERDDSDAFDFAETEAGHENPAGAHSNLTAGGAGGAPFLIQISVVAGPGRFFNGLALKEALLEADLLHGDMGIFHRYDPDLKQALFSVASLVEPGTFPMDDMESFKCPGIVLFFQTARVSDPLSVYDDLINTSRELANHLHGIQWDETRQPLTASKIAHMRNLLRHSASA
jgi:cell division protein ZipA